MDILSTDEESCSTNSGPRPAICQFFRVSCPNSGEGSERSVSPPAPAEFATCIFCQAKCEMKVDRLTDHLQNACSLVPSEVKQLCISNGQTPPLTDPARPADSSSTGQPVGADDQLDHAYTLCSLSSGLGESAL